jgi:hypothetical protein
MFEKINGITSSVIGDIVQTIIFLLHSFWESDRIAWMFRKHYLFLASGECYVTFPGAFFCVLQGHRAFLALMDECPESGLF